MTSSTGSLTTSTRHSYPETLVRGTDGKWQVDEDCVALQPITDPGRRKRGIRQAGKLAKVVNFAESFLKIVTKRAKLEPFRLNAVQVIVVQLIAFCWVQLRPAQILIPKSRQMGISTLLQTLLFVLALLTRNYRCMTVAHREDSAAMIFRMSRTFEEWLPAKFRRELKTRTKGCLEWRDTGSITQVATIGTGDGLGMGFTLNAFHGSEVAVWAKRGDAKAAWTSAAPAIADNEDTLIAFESTPDGPDPFFYDLCVRSLSGFGDWQAVFLPWYLDPTYQISREDYALRVARARLEGEVHFELTAEEQELVKLIQSQPVVAGEEWIRWPCTLTLEQILWRRITIQNKCDGDVDTFNRYYPSTWEMAFRSRDVLLFSGHTIERIKAQSRAPRSVGAMHEVKGEAHYRPRERAEQARSKWQIAIWEAPLPGYEYMIGADVAEGVEGGDFSVCYVGKLDRTLGQVEVVASLHGTIDPDLYAEQLDLLAQWYGDALLAVETNRTFEVMRTLRKRGCRNLYWRTDPTNPRSKVKHPGWHTNTKTRPIMLSILKAMARDNDVVVYDPDLPGEMQDMIPGRNGRWEARKGRHDDRVMALAILLAVAGFRDKRGRRKRDRERPTEAKSESAAVVALHKRKAWAAARNMSKASADESTYSM